MNWRTIAIMTCLLMGTGDIQGELISLNPIKDNTLYQDGDFSNGMGSYLFAGTNSDGNIRRALLAFDVATSLPQEATVTNVRLTLNMSRTRLGSQNVSLHRVLQDWGEGTTDAVGQEGGGIQASAGDATWTHAIAPDTLWGEPGGSFVSDASAEIEIAEVAGYTWGSTEGLVSDVQSWLEAPLANFGWIIVGNESTGETAKRFGSREVMDELQRPVLQIEYELSGPLVGDFDANGSLDVSDIDALTAQVRSGNNTPTFDLNGDGLVSQEDRRIWVDELRETYFGDSNLDGEFNSSDFVAVFQAGEYEDSQVGNSGWSTGDWNGDADFDTSDFVTGFQAGGFEQGPRGNANPVPEPTSFSITIMYVIGIMVLRRRKK